MWLFNGTLLLVGFCFLVVFCLTFPGRHVPAGTEHDTVSEADWDAALLALCFSFLQSMFLLDAIKVIIITLVSPQFMPADKSQSQTITCARWCLRGTMSSLAGLLGAA